MVNKIKYSMCWEDPEVMLSALKITANDNVLSIVSGGENTLAILLKNPKKIIAIDNNSDQIHLFKLKILAINVLDYDSFIKFCGYKKSSERIKIYSKLKKYMGKNDIIFWDNNLNCIKRGIIHSGKFERYLSIFRRYILPIAISKNKIREYLTSESIEEQEKIYYNYWNNNRWKTIFRFFFSKNIMQLIGRDKDYFKHNKNLSISEHYYNKASYGITSIPVKNNYFIEMILTGNIKKNMKEHPYLDKNNFLIIKSRLDRIKIVNQDFHNFLKTSDEKINKYNLSDIFEKDSYADYQNTIKIIHNKSPKNTIICYWNNLVKRKEHGIKGMINEKKLSEKLKEKDRIFFYSDFIIEKKN